MRTNCDPLPRNAEAGKETEYCGGVESASKLLRTKSLSRRGIGIYPNTDIGIGTEH